MPPLDDHVVLVDEHDTPLRRTDKRAAHTGNGWLHRGFLALILAPDGRLLLGRRSAAKPLWDGIWDGTVASHPREGEAYVAAGERRLTEELHLAAQASPSVHLLNRFRYHVPYDEAGVENEVCATLVTCLPTSQVLAPVETEIAELRWVDRCGLDAWMRDSPQQLTPWLLIALHLLAQGQQPGDNRLATALAPWTAQHDNALVTAALACHPFRGDFGII